jgi:hypothetical protein
MIVLGFYRMYAAIAAGGVVYFLVKQNLGLWLAVAVCVRCAWFGVERLVAAIRVERSFKRHISRFREQFGPYGIRLANKAENNRHVKNSLAEVFTDSGKKLKKTLEQLDVMDALFQAGLRPEGDEYLLHDLKRKYAKRRLEEENRPLS